MTDMNPMNIAQLVTRRYTTKAFDPARKIAGELMEQLETLLRFSPSSTNAQPWHFVIASTDEGKARIAQAAQGFFAFNEAKVKNASHVVVFCSRAVLDEAHLQAVLAQEERDGRFANPDAKAGQHRGRSHFVNTHRFELRDAHHWADKQVYLSVGSLLLGAAALGIDACPIEGFDSVVLNEVLGLRERGLTSAVIVALGYRAADDFNAALPKSRLPADAVFTRL